MKLTLQAPLPFQGQKRHFVKSIVQKIWRLPNDVTFVDLFGGSGLLSRVCKDVKPQATVIYNDFDNYSERIRHIPETNRLLSEIRPLVKDLKPNQRFPVEIKQRTIELIQQHHDTYGYVDWITLSSSILFSSSYHQAIEKFKVESLYNNVKVNDYPDSMAYLDGLTVVRKDYSELLDEYSEHPKAVFLVDPPYNNTSFQSYGGKNFNYVDVLQLFYRIGSSSFLFFTDDRAGIAAAYGYLEEAYGVPNPFKDAERHEVYRYLGNKRDYYDLMYTRSPYFKEPSLFDSVE